MRVQGDFGNPIHGVSRQPDSRKFAGQAREQINCRNNITRGMEGRAGFTRLGKLIPDVNSGGRLDNAKWDVMRRGDGTNFLAAYDVTRPSFFRLSDVGKFVARPFSYLQSSETYYQGGIGRKLKDPTKQLGVSTLFDTTFITHRGVVPVGSTGRDNIVEPPHVVWLEFKTFQPGTRIHITVGSGLEYKTQVFDSFVPMFNDEGTQTPSWEKARTREYTGSWHANVFVNGIPSDGPPPPDTVCPLVGSSYNNWVRLDGAHADAVKIVEGGEAISIYDNRTLEAIEKIPPVASSGDVVHIKEGRGEDKNEGYFRASTKNDTAMGEASWKETTAPGSSGSFNKGTMPHVITRDVNDQFTMQEYGWDDRRVGDSSTNPYPSFIEQGEPIQTLGIFQNRLYMTSGETVSMSAVDTYTDLWKESAFYNTDADPFEVYADTDQLNIMVFSDLFDGDLVLFSENGQFAMVGSTVHTYNTARIETVSQYKADLLASPVMAGDNIFFATSYGSFAGVREFFTDGYTATKRSRPVTDHVNDYIEGGIRHFASSTNLDVLCALSDKNRECMYLFEWRWEDNRRQQQAWSRWELPSTEHISREFEWVGFIESEFYAVVKVMQAGITEFELWKMAWDDPPGTHGLPFSVRLDGRFVVDPAHKQKNLDGTTTLRLPYSDPDLVFIEGADSVDAGFQIKSERNQDGSWTLHGDFKDVTVIAGVPYRKVYTPGLPQIRDTKENAQGLDRLQFQSMQLRFQAVGEVTFTISDAHGNKRVNTFNNRRINRANNKPSYVPYEGDVWMVPVRKSAKELTVTLETMSYVPVVLESIEWIGEYKQRGRRV